ncbi:MAG: GNAT family protein [Dehalococcoidia bacterium]|nr:GNAT family N-acetyltransferase [Dehalococcoidia bacterium]MCA9830949.1 GNAT family N-acetyltransferase [Dehalococcoidia bacterium]MCB9485593.1 GNAT family N-acetyltransferase [Thermoflexaceae bacterium]
MASTSLWVGSLVRLRATEASDWEAFWHAAEDTGSQRDGYRVLLPESVSAARERFEREATADPANADRFVLTIESIGDRSIVGSVNAHGIDRRNGTFEYGITVFREFRGRGFASEAIHLLLRYCFDELRFQKANATVYAFNGASIALHRSLGFTEEGRIRSNYYTNGEYHDELWFGITAAEFRARTGPS